MPTHSHCGHGHRGHSRGSRLCSRSLQVWRDAWISWASCGVGSIQVTPGIFLASNAGSYPMLAMAQTQIPSWHILRRLR